ncbi:MAG: hypothetical protein J2P17_20610, partial [Mycobacterium sp.]|nr:hypothetical protein [Mycobacterium sp.]
GGAPSANSPTAAAAPPQPTTARPALAATVAPTSVAAQGATAGARPTGSSPLLPNFIPAAGGPKPDLPSAGPLYEDAFVNYPKSPVKALLPEPPGAGSTVTAFEAALYPPPTPLDQNPAWQAVNKALNADVRFNVVGLADYVTKLATVMSGNDLPDILYLQRGINAAPDLPRFLQAKCADLTSYLAGDAAKDYPYLAAIPTYAWQNSGCAASGKLQMVPIQRYAPGVALFKNQTIYDSEIGKDTLPKNAADYRKMLEQVNRPSQGRYGTASYASTATSAVTGNAYSIDFYAAMFGAPNTWGLDASGKLTRSLETEEYKAAVGYIRDLVAAGLFHPNTLTYNINSARADFIAGSWVMYPEGFGNPWNDFWRRGLQMNPPVNFLPLPPFPANDGGAVQHYLSLGYQATTALKQASPDRIRELLRIMNWLAAPFGSQEDLLLAYGVKDIDYTFDDRGNPVVTDRGNGDANYVPWKYVVQHPQVIYVADIPGWAQAASDAEHMLLPHGVADPTLGYYAPTSSSKGIPINQAFTDGITDIVSGRRPMTDYDQLVSDWRSGGGEQIRREYQDAIAAAKA